MTITRIEIVEPMHPVRVAGVLNWPVNGRGVVDDRGVMYCTEADASEAVRRYGDRRG